MSLPSSAPPAVVVTDVPAAPLPPPDLVIMDQPMLDGPALLDEDSATPMEFGMVDLCECGLAFHPSSLYDSDLMSEVRFHVESVAYDGSKGEFKVIDFCGSRVKLWKPSHVVSDTTLGELDPEGTFKAMQKECDGLTAVKAGVIPSEQKKEEFCKLHGVKPITCRWVTNEKPESDEGVRARIVVKDIARGSATARSQAISRPTPSVESLRMVLGAACGIWGAELSLHAIDVSQAFMNSSLQDKERIVLRMPLSISTTSGEPIFLGRISGAVLMYQAVTIKCFSTHQAAVSLSSCEAELHAIQAGVQESIGLARTLAFVLKSLNFREDLAPLAELEEGECPLHIQLRTDSLSGKQLLESYDLQRRSRHIEIRLCWLRRLLNSSILELTFCRET